MSCLLLIIVFAVDNCVVFAVDNCVVSAIDNCVECTIDNCVVFAIDNCVVWNWEPEFHLCFGNLRVGPGVERL